MPIHFPRRRTRPPAPARTAARALRARRGSALILVLIMTVAIATLALTAIFLNGNAAITDRIDRRERDLVAAADIGLQQGKARLNSDRNLVLPDEGGTQIVFGDAVESPLGGTVPGVRLNVWVGPTGQPNAATGTRFGSVVAEAYDPSTSARVVRRAELVQESFAKFAYFTDIERSAAGTKIVFANNDAIWGPVWSNDQIEITSTGATFYDQVGTAKGITGQSYGTFKLKGQPRTGLPRIELPDVSSLSALRGHAASGGLYIAAGSNGSESQLRTRLEFVWVDVDGDGTRDDTEGFLRVYDLDNNALGTTSYLRGDYVAANSGENCGDWHRQVWGGRSRLAFVPAGAHDTPWFRSLRAYGFGQSTEGTVAATDSAWNAHAVSGRDSIVAQGAAGLPRAPRCFAGGDPHLVANTYDLSQPVSLLGALASPFAGDSSTFFAVDQRVAAATARGRYRRWTLVPAPALVSAVGSAAAAYLIPLNTTANGGYRGVIMVDGSAAVSGTLRGRATLYATNTLAFVDDLQYSIPPGGSCGSGDILGIVTGQDAVVADNALLSPPQVLGSNRNLGADANGFTLHAVVMTLNTSFEVERYNQGANGGLPCGATNSGRGCLNLAGGLIQKNRGIVGQGGSGTQTGYVKRYSYDRCVIENPPPYYPTTGRFTDNRYYEINPVGFNAGNLFNALTPR